jgi:hypothetical protein
MLSDSLPLMPVWLRVQTAPHIRKIRASNKLGTGKPERTCSRPLPNDHEVGQRKKFGYSLTNHRSFCVRRHPCSSRDQQL